MKIIINTNIIPSNENKYFNEIWTNNKDYNSFKFPEKFANPITLLNMAKLSASIFFSVKISKIVI